ncbi:MAG TPA: YkgJ family cysteine cluster protein [Polyangia bacterium]|nr:YkgJ family cysteine cluster protein [Polyangia bacterium]
MLDGADRLGGAPLWRPVLAADAFVRTYVSDAGRAWIVVRRAPGTRVRIDAVQRRLLELCDGRRTVDELAEAIGLDAGRPLSARGVLEALEPLAAAGALVHAGEEAARQSVERGLQVIDLDDQMFSRLAIAIAPRTGFDCDGRGVCCGLYERLLLDPEDVANIRAAYGDELTPGGLSVEGAVHRHRDDDAGGSLELAVVDGACTLLEADRRCGVHRRLGVARKPEGCRAYPIRDVVCGDELSVGLAVECRCVIDFHDGPPIDAMAEAQRARRGRMRLVEAVTERVPVTLARRVPRDEYRAWREAARARLANAPDVAAWAFSEAQRIAGETIARDPLVERAQTLAPLFDEIGRLFELEAANTAHVYSARDLQPQAFAWARDAHRRLRDELRRGFVSVEPALGERVLAEQVLHAHGLLRSRTLACGLFALGLRIRLARAGSALTLVPALLPIPTVEYLHRAQALARLLDEHAASVERAIVD